ncbi:Na/Pi symporter [Endozoicomonas gorgoniicola]|uniref:Na/Pi symporter n=1 Tax=Endozoicomonas gorgoniicola TaxID=1234144 RepID=A0ABT3MZL9_9GAMM|nr:Na/Pi symporter [Endozoicomonas gorgoniicola]MCW7554826.1 Na/Pi symporter [Endozoicomonas gorgoniicola]
MSEMTAVSPVSNDKVMTRHYGRIWLKVILWIYGLLVAVSVIGSGFKMVVGGNAAELFNFANNAFLALIAGTLATALIQSSSTVTSIIVGLVAGGLPVHMAIPMIMGANIGTTITNTVVSLGHMGCNKEFKRAFSASTVHDFFNYLAVLIILPLELMTGFLSKLSLSVAEMLVGGQDMSISFNLVKFLTAPSVDIIKGFARLLPDNTLGGLAMIAFGVFLIFSAVVRLGKLLKKVMTGKAKDVLEKSIGRGPISGIVSGAAMTVMVQSSTTTTCLMVPMVGSGLFSVRQMYPVTLGANIGTTITAILAATAISGNAAMSAMTIAMVHLFFNLFAVALIYGIKPLREIPLFAAEKLAELAVKKKAYAFAYLALAFFVLPGLAIFLTK